MYGNDRLAVLQQTILHGLFHTPLDSCVNVFLPWGDFSGTQGSVAAVSRHDGSSRAGFGVDEREASTIQVDLTSSLCIASNDDDGCFGAVLGEETGRVARGGENNDGTGLLLVSSADGRAGNGLGGFGGQSGQGTKFVEDSRVAEDRFSQDTDIVHGLYSLDRIAALGSLAGKHDTVGAVQDGVGNVRYFGTGGTGVVLKTSKSQDKRFDLPIACLTLTVMDSNIWVAL